MKDINGREYAKVSDVKVGHVVEVDGDFTCLAEGTLCTVYADAKGDKFINCVHGPHYLAGQYEHDDAGDYYVGLYPT